MLTLLAQSLLVPALLLLPAQDPVVNGSFDEGALGETPPNWFVPEVCRDNGYRAATIEVAEQGEVLRCGWLTHNGATKGEAFGNLIQSVDADAWRGKGVRLRASVRVAGEETHAQLWLRVDREGLQQDITKQDLLDNMHDRPIEPAEEWADFEIRGRVADDAERMVFGMMLFGTGSAEIDDVELEVLELPAPEPPRPLEGRAAENLRAFARLFGYVRYFHPSDEVARADWPALAIEGVRTVESATSASELALRLQAAFAPVAPTVQVYPTGAAPEPPAALARPVGAPGQRLDTWIRTWRHRGHGSSGSGAIYRSSRTKTRIRDAELPEGVRDPAALFEVELGGGVSARVPQALWADRGGTLPHGAEAAAAASLEAELASGQDRATRLADVVLAWNVFQHFYPYFDVVGTDWTKELEPALASAATDAGERAFLDTLRRMVAALRDGHGHVWHTSWQFNGYLPFAWDWVEGQLVITHNPPTVLSHPADGAPQSILGLERGAVVLSIGGIPVDAAFKGETALISSATPQWMRWRGREALAAGTVGSQITVQVRSLAGAEHQFLFTFQPADPSREEPRPEKVAELQPGIYYVDIDRITDEDFESALPELEQARGIVFDLRGYPNNLSAVVLAHLIDEPIQCPSWNIPIVTQPDRQGWTYDQSSRWTVQPAEPRLRAKVAWITDGRAISYAETYLGMVEHYRLGEIVGEPTAGTNGNVNPFVLPGAYHISWTGMKVLKHDGSRHHGVGIQPTVPCSRTIAGVAEGKDELLLKALEVVSR